MWSQEASAAGAGGVLCTPFRQVGAHSPLWVGSLSAGAGIVLAFTSLNRSTSLMILFFLSHFQVQVWS